MVDPVDDPCPPMTKTAWSSVTAACESLFFSNDPILFSSHWPVLASKTRQEERALPPSDPPQVAITGSSPAVRKVVWIYRLPGREGGKQFEVGGKTSVEESWELPSLPPVRRSRFALLVGPENDSLNDDSNQFAGEKSQIVSSDRSSYSSYILNISSVELAKHESYDKQNLTERAFLCFTLSPFTCWS